MAAFASSFCEHSGANERIIRLTEMPVDPLEPPKFKHKRVLKASGSPPVPVMHSPPDPVTVKDQQDWKIPPCISNWKNPKGYTIPLDKRLAAADGRRGLQEVQINDNFATDDQYNVYDKGLFTAQSAMNNLYKPRRDNDEEMYGGADEQLDKVLKTERFKPDKKFSGAPDKAAPRDRPVEFEKPVEEADPFGLDLFLTEVEKGKKAMDKVGSGGTMKASAGSSMRDGWQ